MRGARASWAMVLALVSISVLGSLVQTQAAGSKRALQEADDYSYDYGYDSYYYDDDEYDYLDEYGYYEDDDEAYYDYYGYYADDAEDMMEGYDDYYYDYYDDYDYLNDRVGCTMDGTKVKLANGTVPCDLKISGVDKQAGLLKGGLDGVYKLTSCHNGKPLYKRKDSPAGEDRVLWYSNSFGDWDLSKGVSPNEAEILMYGGEVDHASVPLFVRNWQVGADLVANSSMEADDYVPISLTIKCADGKVYKEDKFNPSKLMAGPVLTDDEMEAKYRYIYDKYGRRPEPNPTINFSFVVMLVMVGLTIVLVIPYFLLQKKGVRAPPVTGTFAHLIQQSKKKSSGHLN